MTLRLGFWAAAGALFALATSLAGCDAVVADRSLPPVYGVDFPVTRDPVSRDTDIVLTSYAATDRLMNESSDAIDRDKAILVASIANVDDLGQSSSFGRIVAEQVASRLAQLGYRVVESKLRATMAINENGEFMLSRDARKIAASHDAQAVVTGSYAAGVEATFVSLKLVRLADAKVVAAFDYSVPMGPNTESLITSAARQ